MSPQRHAKGDRTLKKTLAALMLTAAVATPAMAQTYVQSNGWASNRGRQTQSQTGMGYDAYAYAPRGWDSSDIQSPAFAMDPDPSVRHQLQIQSDISDR
jgi:hypothetical protein